MISIWPWIVHRHAALWDEPDTFRIERFALGKSARHRFQYLPFGGGPRVCVGARSATVEALTILAHWLASWRFAPEPRREVRPFGIVTLGPFGMVTPGPFGGLPLRLSRR